MKVPKITYHDVSRETFRLVDELFQRNRVSLETYISRLQWWNKSFNLISRNITKDVVREHVRHSLLPTILPGFKCSQVILDAGTGGGLPGIPIAICFSDKKIILNDVSHKKTTILDHLKRELHLNNTHIANYPLSQYIITDDSAECIVSKHAFKTDEILKDIKNGNWKTLIMFKGNDFIDEISDISYPVSIECHCLETGTKIPFYRGKVMLNIQRIWLRNEE